VTETYLREVLHLSEAVHAGDFTGRAREAVSWSDKAADAPYHLRPRPIR